MERPEDVIGKDDYDLVWKKDAAKYRADDNFVIKTGQPKVNYEEVFFNRKGKKIWWLTNKMPLRSNDGHIIGLISVSQHITDKNAEKEKLILEAQLQQSQKMESIGILAGGIAHDFNNILSAVIGFTELALDAVEKGTSIESDLHEVYTAGLRAKDLVQQILTFARQSDEKLKPIKVDFIIKEVLKFIRSSTPTTIEFKPRW